MTLSTVKVDRCNQHPPFYFLLFSGMLLRRPRRDYLVPLILRLKKTAPEGPLSMLPKAVAQAVITTLSFFIAFFSS